jgi:hypothetical protein
VFIYRAIETVETVPHSCVLTWQKPGVNEIPPLTARDNEVAFSGIRSQFPVHEDVPALRRNRETSS